MSSPRSLLKAAGLGGSHYVRSARRTASLSDYKTEGPLGCLDRVAIATAAERVFRSGGGYSLMTDAEPHVEGFDELADADHAEAVRFLMGMRGHSQFRAFRSPWPTQRKRNDQHS